MSESSQRHRSLFLKRNAFSSNESNWNIQDDQRTQRQERRHRRIRFESDQEVSEDEQDRGEIMGTYHPQVGRSHLDTVPIVNPQNENRL